MSDIEAWTKLLSPRDAIQSSVSRMTSALEVLERWKVVIEDQPEVYAMKALSELSGIRDCVSTDIRLLAEHTSKTTKQSRNSIARAAGVANTTVNAWAAAPSTFSPDYEETTDK